MKMTSSFPFFVRVREALQLRRLREIADRRHALLHIVVGDTFVGDEHRDVFSVFVEAIDLIEERARFFLPGDLAVSIEIDFVEVDPFET